MFRQNAAGDEDVSMATPPHRFCAELALRQAAVLRKNSCAGAMVVKNNTASASSAIRPQLWFLHEKARGLNNM
jgi:hypothetical protein